MKSIIRVQKDSTNPYVMLNKIFLSNDNMSYKAKGILAYLLSKPDNWQVKTFDLIKNSKDGEKSVYSGLKELKDHGYLKRYPVYVNGKISHWESVVYEVPQLQNAGIKKEESLINKDYAENYNAENLLVGNVEIENVEVEKRQDLIKNDINDNDINNNYKTTTTTTEVKQTEVKPEPKEDIVVVKEKIEKVIKAKIKPQVVKDLLTHVGIDRIEYYLEHWQRFKGTKKSNVVGFFIKAVVEEYDIPTEEQARKQSNISQHHNFEQRTYTDDYYESLYANGKDEGNDRD